MTRRARTVLCAVFAPVLACGDAPITEPAAPAADITAGYSRLVVRLRAPGGGFACDSLPAGTVLPVFLEGWLQAEGIVTCGTSETVAFQLQEGKPYLIHVEGSNTPWAVSSMHPSVIELGPNSVLNVRLAAGRLLAGEATLGGRPFAGYRPRILMEGPLGGAITVTPPVAGADGRWRNASDYGYRLQPERSYLTECRPANGTTLVSATGATTLEYAPFPAVWSEMTCRFAMSPRRAVTHRATNLQLTAEPALLNPFRGSPEAGFGVAYPTGGLLDHFRDDVGRATLVVSDGVSVAAAPAHGSLAGCAGPQSTSCPWLVGAAARVDRDAGVHRVRYALHDSSGVGRTLGLTQTSWDGSHGDYVLYRFALTNEAAAARTFHLAWVVDWDIYEYADTVIFPEYDNRAGTALEGRLMYAHTSAADRWYGTYWLGPVPIAANHAGATCCIPSGARFDVLSGAVTSPSAGPAELYTAHGVGPIHLEPGASRAVWMAFVAAASFDELVNTARAARDEARDRRSPD